MAITAPWLLANGKESPTFSQERYGRSLTSYIAWLYPVRFKNAHRNMLLIPQLLVPGKSNGLEQKDEAGETLQKSKVKAAQGKPGSNRKRKRASEKAKRDLPEVHLKELASPMELSEGLTAALSTYKGNPSVLAADLCHAAGTSPAFQLLRMQLFFTDCVWYVI